MYVSTFVKRYGNIVHLKELLKIFKSESYSIVINIEYNRNISLRYSILYEMGGSIIDISTTTYTGVRGEYEDIRLKDIILEFSDISIKIITIIKDEKYEEWLNTTNIKKIDIDMFSETPDETIEYKISQKSYTI